MRRRRLREPGRMPAQVAHEPTTGDERDDEQAEQQCRLARRMVANRADDEHEQRDRDEQDRHGAVEAARLRMRPGIERLDDLAALIGVGARVLEGQRLHTCAFAR